MMFSTEVPSGTPDVMLCIAPLLMALVLLGAVWMVKRFKKPAVCFVKVTPDCAGRMRQEQIDERVVDFLRDLAMLKGFGLNGDRAIQYNGTDIVARFAFEDDGTGKPKIDKDCNLPVVLMWTIYHDMNRLNPDGTKKKPGQHARTWRVRSRDHQEGVDN